MWSEFVHPKQRDQSCFVFWWSTQVNPMMCGKRSSCRCAHKTDTFKIVGWHSLASHPILLYAFCTILLSACALDLLVIRTPYHSHLLLSTRRVQSPTLLVVLPTHRPSSLPYIIQSACPLGRLSHYSPTYPSTPLSSDRLTLVSAYHF